MGFDKTHTERVHRLVSPYHILSLKTWTFFSLIIKRYKRERCVLPCVSLCISNEVISAIHISFSTVLCDDNDENINVTAPENTGTAAVTKHCTRYKCNVPLAHTLLHFVSLCEFAPRVLFSLSRGGAC